MIKKKVRNILVPLDGSKNSMRGLDTAIYIARQCHAIVIGINVMPVSIFTAVQPADFMPAYSTLQSYDIIKQFKKNAKSFLESAKLKAARQGILFKTKIMQGQPGQDIIRVAHDKKNKIDLIVIGSRGRGSAKELFFGSTSNYIIHRANVPVVVIK